MRSGVCHGYALALVAALLLWGAPAWGSQSVPLNLQQISRAAGAIFVGRALDVRSERDLHGLPATQTTFEVELVLKGNLSPGERVVVKHYGYAQPKPAIGEFFRVHGMPRYRLGGRYVLMLYPPSKLGFQSPVGFGQGVFQIGPDGQAVNELGNGGLSVSGQRLIVEHRSGPLALRDLLEIVAAMVGSPVDEGRLRALEARLAEEATGAAAVRAQAGPLLATDGLPVPWDIPSAINSSPSLTAIPYNPDQGALGALTKAQADQLVADAFAVWDAVADSSVAFADAGDLPVDVTAANVNSVLGVQDGLSPIVYDVDGSITAALNGAGAECDILGFAGPEFGGPDSVFGAVITEASAVLNGLFVDGQSNFAQCGFNAEMSVDAYRGVFVHEFGHYANLDHTQVNGQHTAAFLGGVGEPAFPGVLGEPPLESTNTMFPIAIGNDANTLGFDDVVSIATQYPAADFLGRGAIEGRVLQPDGTPFNCASVIVRSQSDPFFTAAASVTGAFTFDTAFGGPNFTGENGKYRVPGLPGGSYVIHVEAVNANFTEGSSVGPCDPPVALPGPAEFYSGAGESADAAVDNPADFTPVAVSGSAVTGVDIVLNGAGGGTPPPITLDILRDLGRCVITPARSIAFRMLMLRNSSSSTVNITNVAPAAGSDWVDFMLTRGLGSVIPGRFAVILARGTCVGEDLALDITFDNGAVATAGAITLSPAEERSGPATLALRGGLLLVRAYGADVRRISTQIYRLDGRKVVEAQVHGSRLAMLAQDERGRPLANGVYLVVITVERRDGTLERGIRKVVILSTMERRG